MKKLFSIGIVIVSFTIIIGGSIYYDNRLSSIAESAQNQEFHEIKHNTIDDQNIEEETITESDESDDDSDTVDKPVVNVDSLLPEFAEVVSGVRESGDELKIAIYASDTMLSIEGEGQTWPELLDNEFSEAFHDISYDIAVYSAEDLNTVEIIQTADYERVLESDRHFIIVESMLWNDNGQVSNEQSVEYINQIKNSYETAGSEVITLLSPPAYQTVNYPLQIDFFSNYAVNNEWLLADHWNDWPELNDDALLNFVDGESRYLTSAGHEVVVESIFDVLGIN